MAGRCSSNWIFVAAALAATGWAPTAAVAGEARIIQRGPCNDLQSGFCFSDMRGERGGTHSTVYSSEPLRVESTVGAQVQVTFVGSYSCSTNFERPIEGQSPPSNQVHYDLYGQLTDKPVSSSSFSPTYPGTQKITRRYFNAEPSVRPVEASVDTHPIVLTKLFAVTKDIQKYFVAFRLDFFSGVGTCEVRGDKLMALIIE